MKLQLLFNIIVIYAVNSICQRTGLNTEIFYLTQFVKY